jgi:hypothetical protein
MSDTLSTVIAFAGFLMVFSMLVQSFQEILKNLLKLKTGVWERFFRDVYENEFLSDDEQREGVLALLKNTISSSTERIWDPIKRVWAGQVFGDFEKRFQNIKDIITKAKERLKELREELCKIKDGDPSQEGFMQSAQPVIDKIHEITVLKLDKLLNIYDKYRRNQISSFYKQLSDFEDKIFYKEMPKEEEAAKKFIEAYKKGYDELVRNLVVIEKAFFDYQTQIENKIDSWMAQVNAEYRRNMLKWTVLIGLVFVFVFNADSFTMFRYLSLNPKVKANIIKSASDKKNEAATNALQIQGAERLEKAGNFLKEGKNREAGEEILALSQDLQSSFKDLGEGEKAGQADNIKEQTKKIIEEAKEPAAPESPNVKVALEKNVDQLSALYIYLQSAAVNYQFDRLGALDLPLGWGKEWPAINLAVRYSQWKPLARKLSGLLLTTFLITFGAPFWNEVMNTLLGIGKMRSQKTESS